MKVCSACKTEKSLEEFYKNRSKTDGLSSECKECALGRVKKYQEDLREKIGDDAFRARNREAVRRYRERQKSE